MVIEDIEDTDNFKNIFEIIKNQINISEKFEAEIIYGHGLTLVIKKIK